MIAGVRSALEVLGGETGSSRGEKRRNRLLFDKRPGAGYRELQCAYRFLVPGIPRLICHSLVFRVPTRSPDSNWALFNLAVGSS